MGRKIALVDADSIIYILGWKFKDIMEGYENLMEREVNNFMVDLIQATGATHYLGVFTPSLSFRYQLATIKPYKGNRPPAADWVRFWKPKIIDFCIKNYGYIVANNIEADDVMSIMHKGMKSDDEVVICAIDKDMMQLPGIHYNYTKQKFIQVSLEEARLNYWTQVLVGDTTDNIPGAKGIGPKKAAKLLTVPEEQYQNVVEATFKKIYGEQWELFYRETVSLVKLLEPLEAYVEYYGSKIQAVQVSDRDAVQDILNIETQDGPNAGVLQDSERPHEGDVLRSPSDLS